MVPTFAQKDIVDHLGVAPRVLAFWSDQNVLLPVERGKNSGGSGVHRRFAESEVEIAAILFQASALKLPIGTLRDIAAWVRTIQRAPNIFKPALRFEEKNLIQRIVDDKSEPIGSARTAKAVSWFHYYAARHRPEAEHQIMMRVAPVPLGWNGYIIDDWGDEFNWSPTRDGHFNFDCCIEINLTKAFAPFHPEEE
jgi:DNA-binding transcriptional MerR regulator